jgi:restriction endonuclease Mrr
MKFTQLTKTPTAEDLNNRVAQMFGSKINLESFTAEQLSTARDKLANQLLTIENQANFDAIHTSEAYQKNRLFLKVIEQKIEELSQTDEKAKNPYAIGMAQAMKSTGDQPPLKKSTITKAHDIAKSVEKNESETAVDENMTRQHFQYVADTLKDIQDPIKKAEYAKHHSAIFQHFNPNFDHAKFMAAAGVEMKEPAEAVAEAKPDFLDMDKDGDKKEPMKKAIQDKKKKNIKEGAEESARIVMSANGLVDKRIVLIDGGRLTQLMVTAGVGVSVKDTYVVHRLDEDFFSEFENV